MSSPGPQILIGGADAEAILALAEKCKRAVQVVETYLRAGDDKGADEYLAAFERENGTRAHGAVMKMLQTIYGSPDWRTFS